jgi:hypothetical protein
MILQLTRKLEVYRCELILGDETASNAGLVAHYHKIEPAVDEMPKRADDAGQNDDLGGIGHVTEIFDQRAVAVEEHGSSICMAA